MKIKQNNIIKAMWILVIVVSVVLLYQFIFLPIQMNKKLQECLSIPSLNGTGTQDQVKEFEDYCFKKYSRK